MGLCAHSLTLTPTLTQAPYVYGVICTMGIPHPNPTSNDIRMCADPHEGELTHTLALTLSPFVYGPIRTKANPHPNPNPNSIRIWAYLLKV